MTKKRVLALDVSPCSFGFAVFEGHNELLDWGVKRFRRSMNAVKMPLREKLAILLADWAPDVVVMKKPMTTAHGRVSTRILAIGKARRIPIRLLSRKEVRAAFPDCPQNKHQIASAIATRFPELAARLPPKRKPWQSEDYRMSIFDAAALGMTFFSRNGEGTHFPSVFR
ncbi:MAG: hypothetical protein ACRD3L_03395 [Terriglobales bacterium]